MPKEKKARHWTCNQCHLKTSFSSTDELDKHLQTQHHSAMYSCTAVGCCKRTSAPKYQKSETLTQHIKESHTHDTIYLCPVKTCTFTPSRIDDLAIHAHWEHTKHPSQLCYRDASSSDNSVSVASIINAATWMYFRCPIWSCRKLFSGGHKKVSAHLLAHFPTELLKVQDALAIDGYQLRSNLEVLRPGDVSCQDISVHIKCPACKVLCENEKVFKHHIEADHMIEDSPEALQHFDTWREDVISDSLKDNVELVSSRPCWLDRHIYPRLGKSEILLRSRVTSLKCTHSTCLFELIPGQKGHSSFLRSAESIATTLWPHRVQILRHYPQFLTYTMLQKQVPVFG